MNDITAGATPDRNGVFHVASISGGKDSDAMALDMMETAERKGFTPIFVVADTGNEHPLTVEFWDTLEAHLGLPIHRLKGDFRDAIKRKRWIIDTKWRREGVPEWKINQALGEMYPTGNPFVDLCLAKGRFPSRRAQFCTEWLKGEVILQNAIMPLARLGKVLSWQGVRSEESDVRLKQPRFQKQDFCWVYRPIKHWTIDDVFAIHRRHGLKPNPLYSMGMTRVGCMPCVNCKKGELLEISKRFPEVIDRIEEWEGMVSRASKRGISSFFPDTERNGRDMPNIRAAVEWAKTSGNRRQYDIEALMGPSPCSSAYGLCDTDQKPGEFV